MRILTISHMFPSVDNERHGIFICRQAQALRRHGIELCFLVGRPWAPWPLYYTQRWGSYRTVYALVVPSGFSARPVRYVRPPGLWFRRFDGRSMAWSLQGAAKEWHKQEPFDMVLGVSMFPDAEAAVIIGRHLNVPVATLAVGSDVMVYPDRLPALHKHLARTLAQVDLPLGVSESICRKLAQAGTCKRPPLSTYLARDKIGFAPVSDKRALRRELGWPAQDIIGLYVGGLIQSKGVGDLIAAARPLLATHDRLKLVCLGDGPLRTDLAEAGCVLPGRVRPEEVGRYLRAADFLVLPSHSEGMPQAILEAMDCGLPVVATNVGGIPEAVIDGQTGLLVEPCNIAQLRDAIRRMATDTDFRIEAGRRGLERARTVFDSQRNTAILAQAFKEVDRQSRRVCPAHQ